MFGKEAVPNSENYAFIVEVILLVVHSVLKRVNEQNLMVGRKQEVATLICPKLKKLIFILLASVHVMVFLHGTCRTQFGNDFILCPY